MVLDDGEKAFDQIGYPYYVMPIFGTHKILVVVGLWQPNRVLRERAFAGFTFNFPGAQASWAMSDGPTAFAILPSVMSLALLVLVAIYWLMKKPVWPHPELQSSETGFFDVRKL